MLFVKRIIARVHPIVLTALAIRILSIENVLTEEFILECIVVLALHFSPLILALHFFVSHQTLHQDVCSQFRHARNWFNLNPFPFLRNVVYVILLDFSLNLNTLLSGWCLTSAIVEKAGRMLVGDFGVGNPLDGAYVFRTFTLLRSQVHRLVFHVHPCLRWLI